MGIWNAHTSVGNIMGSLLSGAALSSTVHSFPHTCSSHSSLLFSSLSLVLISPLLFFLFRVFVFPFLTLIMEPTSVCSSLSCSLPSYVAGMHGNDWPMAFYLSGGLISCMGLIVCCILPNKPEDVGLPSLAEEERR